jgi:hypothetical protein
MDLGNLAAKLLVRLTRVPRQNGQPYALDRWTTAASHS